MYRIYSNAFDTFNAIWDARVYLSLQEHYGIEKGSTGSALKDGRPSSPRIQHALLKAAANLVLAIGSKR